MNEIPASYPYSVAVLYDDDYNIKEGSFDLNAVRLVQLEVTVYPSKVSYRDGEIISYSGMIVTATFSNDNTEIVTDKCVITPAFGKAFDPDSDTHVEIIYSEGQDSQSCNFTLTHYYITNLEITTPPAKTHYKYGEVISYDGMVITASYSDGTTIDVTNQCTITPAAGKAFDPETDTLLEISYGESGSAISTTLALTSVTLNNIAVTSNPVTTSYHAGDPISYDGMVITASYSDGSTEDVTSLCTISPAAGKAFDPETDTTISISYSELGSDGLVTENLELNLTAITLTGLSVTSNPNKTAYKYGEAMTYTGLVVTANYSDGSTKDVTGSCIISPVSGKAFNPETDTSVEISYTEGSTTETASIMLTEIYLTGLQVTTNPTKTAYKYGEAIDYTGLAVTAAYSDGSTSVVTGKCRITPSSGKAFDPEKDTYAEISYSEGQNGMDCTLTLITIMMTSLQVTTNPNKTAYNVGEAIDYTGIIVTASYSDNTTDDVTAKCTFSPSSGTVFDSEIIVTITYTEGQSEQTCSLILTETQSSSMTLVIDTMPTKTSYNQGDTLDYTGVVIKAVHSDGTQHTVTDYCEFSPANGSTVTGAETKVTVKCAPPATPYVFDQNSGYVDNGVWKYEKPTNTYIDIYEVMAGHKYLLTLGGDVGSRFRAMFTTIDVSTASGNVSGTKIININNPEAYANVSYTPSSNGYIVVGKDNIGKSGVKTYLYDANASSSERTATVEFTLTSSVLTSIAVTRPVKTRHRVGEKLDYTGAIVTANYSDGSIVNVTNSAVFSPAEGTTVTSANPAEVIVSPVLVSYTDAGGTSKNTSFNITKGGVAIVSLSVTPPDKTLYYVGDTIDYTGCTVTAVYWDGSTKDVTSSAVFSPAAGTTVSKYDVDENNNLAVSVSYQEIDEVLASNVSIDDYDYDKEYGYDSWYDADYSWYTTLYATVTSIDVSTGQTQTKTFSVDVSEYTDFPAKFGFDDYIDRNTGNAKNVNLKGVIPKWPEQRGGQVGFVLHLYHNLIDPHLVPYVDYYGEKWWDSTWNEETYLGRCYAGEEFLPFMTAYYDAHASYSFNLSVITLQDELSITPPTKTTYHYGEALDYTGCVAIAQYSNGDTVDITASARFSPTAGTQVTSSRTVWVEYSNDGDEYAENSFPITVSRLSGIDITPPTKTSYHVGEVIDYAGATVTARYSDGSTENVTSSAVFSPVAGTEITEGMTGTVSVSVSYTNLWAETATGNLSLSIVTDSE